MMLLFFSSELYEQTIIAVGCTSGIFFINAKTLDILNWIDFSGNALAL